MNIYIYAYLKQLLLIRFWQRILCRPVPLHVMFCYTMYQFSRASSCICVCVSGLVDALSIDWSSLVQPGPRRPVSPPPGSALERFSAGSVLRELGVCAEWAGPGLMETLREQCSGGEYWQCPQRAGRLCRVGRSRADGDAQGTVLRW